MGGRLKKKPSTQIYIFVCVCVCMCVFLCVCMLCSVVQSYPTLCDPMDCSLPVSSVHGDFTGKNTRRGCHALLQGIFPTQRSNPGLLHCRQILYQLSPLGNPYICIVMTDLHCCTVETSTTL